MKVILNPDRSDDQRILDFLLYAGSSKSQAVKTAVLFYLDHKDGENHTASLLQQVREAVREGVQGLHVSSVSSVLTASEAERDDEPVSALDFLDELDEGGPFSDE